MTTTPIEDAKIIEELKETYGGLEVYTQATTVWVGNVPPYASTVRKFFKVENPFQFQKFTVK